MVKTINIAAPMAIANILEGMTISSPITLPKYISINENDSNLMIDKLATAIKFNAPDGDADNSFNEGSDDEEIKLDENGNYVGKGKMTIFNKDVNLKEPSKTTEQWMETSTGKVSDAKTEQVPTLQGEKTATINENDGNLPMDFSDANPNASLMDEEEPDAKTHAKIITNNHKESVAHQKALDSLDKPKVQSVIKNLLKTPTNGGM